jgi:phosphoglycerate dehydrogenase-like enzyme
MSSPPVRGPVVVLVSFPPDPPDPELERLRNVSDRVDLRVCSYLEPHSARTARGAGARVEVPELDPAFAAELAAAHALLALDLPDGVAELAPELRWVQAVGAGVEHLLRHPLPERIALTNAAGVAAVPIAEFVIARLLGVWKRTTELDALQRDHRWEPTYGRQLAGSSLLVVGLGAIGAAVAERAHALGVEVLAIRGHPRPHPNCAEVAGPERLHELLGRVDAVVLSAPAIAETESMFDAAAFAAMRAGSVFCNVARGSLVDEDALADALRSGHLGAAVLDVTRREPLPEDSPLWDVPNCAISPHSASAPGRYVMDLYGFFADNLSRWLAGEPLRNLVDRDRGY